MHHVFNSLMQNFEHIDSLLIADSEHITGGSSISIPCTSKVLYYYPSREARKS